MANIINFICKIENWGWPILLSIIALYLAMPYFKQTQDDERIHIATAEKKRITFLNEQMKRARMRQGLDYYKNWRLRKEAADHYDDLECGE